MLHLMSASLLLHSDLQSCLGCPGTSGPVPSVWWSSPPTGPRLQLLALRLASSLAVDCPLPWHTPHSTAQRCTLLPHPPRPSPPRRPPPPQTSPLPPFPSPPSPAVTPSSVSWALAACPTPPPSPPPSSRAGSSSSSPSQVRQKTLAGPDRGHTFTFTVPWKVSKVVACKQQQR